MQLTKKRRPHFRALPARLIRFAILPLLFGCTSLSSVDPSPASGVAVLINRTWTEQDPRGFTWDVSKDEQATEERFAACVRDAADVPVQVVSGTQFRARAFPDLDPRSAPRSIETLRALMPDPRFRQRIEAAGIRYLAIVGGQTETSELKGDIVCVSGYGGGGCFGHLWRDHESHLSALVVDVFAGSEWAKEGIEASGTSRFAMLAIFPFAVPSGHEVEGCTRFGRAVAEALGRMHGQGK